MYIFTPKLHCTEVGLCISDLKLHCTEVGLCISDPKLHCTEVGLCIFAQNYGMSRCVSTNSFSEQPFMGLGIAC